MTEEKILEFIQEHLKERAVPEEQPVITCTGGLALAPMSGGVS